MNLSKMLNSISLLIVLFLGLLAPATGYSAISVIDDRGVTVTLTNTATRIISLSPHITELLYSLGVGHHIVGTVEYSDYPPAAHKLTRIGSAVSIDMERIVRLKPDLVIGWISGNRASDIQQIARLGIPTFMIEPHSLSDIPRHIKLIGHLLGVDAAAMELASKFKNQLDALRSRPRKSQPVRVFYQIWNPPLMTLGATHIISEAISLCGGENIYDDINSLTATVSIEDVLFRAPDIILAGVVPAQPDPLTIWAKYPSLDAVKNKALFRLNANEIHRPTMRMLNGIKTLCDLLDGL